ncbi:unnamed protein product [Caretta caretta]
MLADSHDSNYIAYVDPHFTPCVGGTPLQSATPDVIIWLNHLHVPFGPVGQPIFHPGPEACLGHQLAAPSWGCEHRCVFGVVYPVPDTCPFCGVREILAHVYLECARLQPLYQLLTNILLHSWLHFSPHLLLYALPIHGPTKSRDLLVSLLLALAKPAIYKTRERRLADGDSCDCGACFQSSVLSCIWAEFFWVASTGSLDTFEEQWALSGVLCSVSPSGSLLLTL